MVSPILSNQIIIFHFLTVMVGLFSRPGTCYDFIDVIPKLTSNESGQSFHVVCPDLPSFGFSGKPKAKGFDALAVGRVMNALMIKLGYIKYVAAGGDWGSLISR